MVSELAKQLGVNASALEFPEVIKFLYDHCEEYVNPTHIVVGLLNKAITEGTQENTRHYSYHFRIVKSDTLIKVPPTHLERFDASITKNKSVRDKVPKLSVSILSIGIILARSMVIKVIGSTVNLPRKNITKSITMFTVSLNTAISGHPVGTIDS